MREHIYYYEYHENNNNPTCYYILYEIMNIAMPFVKQNLKVSKPCLIIVSFKLKSVSVAIAIGSDMFNCTTYYIPTNCQE